MNLKKLHEMGTELEGWLRMRSHPVAVKLEEHDLKDNYRRLAERVGMDMRKSLNR